MTKPKIRTKIRMKMRMKMRADIGMKIINQCNNNQDWGKHQTKTNIDEQNIQELQIARILFPAI